MGDAKVATEQKTRAPEVPGLSKTREVQNLEDFGSKNAALKLRRAPIH